jgi:hypothetical protein
MSSSPSNITNKKTRKTAVERRNDPLAVRVYKPHLLATMNCITEPDIDNDITIQRKH